MPKIVELPFYQLLKDRLQANVPFIQVVVGPRQVGKNTTVLHFLEAHYKEKAIFKSADAVFSDGHAWLEEVWQQARREAELLVIDEIQKIENWSEIVKKLWDADRQKKRELRCLLLGCSSLKIYKGLSESLTGHFQLIRAYHWNYSESAELTGMHFDE